MQKWEYLELSTNNNNEYIQWRYQKKIDDWQDQDKVSYLNMMGSKGWELVSIFRMGYQNPTVYYFKRLIE